MKRWFRDCKFLAALVLSMVIAIFFGYFGLEDNFGSEYCDWGSKHTNWSSQGNPCAILWKPLLQMVGVNFIALTFLFYVLLSCASLALKIFTKILKRIRKIIYGPDWKYCMENNTPLPIRKIFKRTFYVALFFSLIMSLPIGHGEFEHNAMGEYCRGFSHAELLAEEKEDWVLNGVPCKIVWENLLPILGVIYVVNTVLLYISFLAIILLVRISRNVFKA